MNPPIPHQKTVIRPLAQGLKGSVEPVTKARFEKASQPLDPDLLTKKLLHVQQVREEQEQQEQFGRMVNDRLAQMDDTDDQSILDQHVSRVFSPHRTPGTVSPGQLHRPAMNEMSTSLSDFGESKFLVHVFYFLLEFSRYANSLFYTRNLMEFFCAGKFSATPFKVNTRPCIDVGGCTEKATISMAINVR